MVSFSLWLLHEFSESPFLNGSFLPFSITIFKMVRSDVAQHSYPFVSFFRQYASPSSMCFPCRIFSQRIWDELWFSEKSGVSADNMDDTARRETENCRSLCASLQHHGQ